MTTPSQPTGDSELQRKIVLLLCDLTGANPEDPEESIFEADCAGKIIQLFHTELEKFAAAVIAGGPKDSHDYSDEYNQNRSDGWNDAIDQYKAAVTTALEAFLGGGK